MIQQDAYPLAWPAGWPRTASYQREHGQFDAGMDKTRRELLREIDMIALGRQARTHTMSHLIVISTNVPLRRDGFPRADKRPDDPGVAVYFERKGKPVCFACDKYNEVWKNMRAIQKTIEALRGIERWGSSQLLDRAFTGFTALPHRTGESPWDILGVTPEVDEGLVLAAYRERAKQAHPDAGGSHEAFAALSNAKDIALATIRSRNGS